MPETFTVTTETVHTFRAGWGVSVTPIWDAEEETDRVSDIDVAVVEISETAVRIVGGVPCVPLDAGMFVPVDNFADVPELPQDDSHDLRTRWFASREAAEEHAKGVIDLWHNPLPWTSFVVLS